MTSNLRRATQQPMNYVMRLKAGGTLGRGTQCIAFPKVQCKLIREYTWGSSLKVSGEEESKKNWKNWNLTCLVAATAAAVVLILFRGSLQKRRRSPINRWETTDLGQRGFSTRRDIFVPLLRCLSDRQRSSTRRFAKSSGAVSHLCLS